MSKGNERKNERYAVRLKEYRSGESGEMVKWLDIVDTQDNNEETMFCTSYKDSVPGSEERAREMVKQRLLSLNALPCLYVDFDEIDRGEATEKVVWYVMREGETDDKALFNSYSERECQDFIAGEILNGRARLANRYYSLSIEDVNGSKWYCVKGKGSSVSFPHTEEGYERARNLMDKWNKEYAYMEKPSSTTALSTATGKYVTTASSAISTYSPPKPKPVGDKRLRHLLSRMKGGNQEKPYELLFALCRADEKSLTAWLIESKGFTDISHIDRKMGEGDLLFKKGKDPKRKDGKRVLAVAHRDTVIKNAEKNPQYVSWWEDKEKPDNGKTNDSLDDVLISSCFDDRAGVFTILHMLPFMGVDCDVLFTTDEECGQSTAQFFSLEKARELTGYAGEGSPYSHIIEFDRRREDVVAYDYEDNSESWKRFEKELHGAGFVIGQGTFTDIGYLTQLLAKAVNIGTGVRDEHAVKSILCVREYLSQLCRYVTLYNRILKDSLSFPHEDKGGHRFRSYGYQDWDGYDSRSYQGGKTWQSSGNSYTSERDKEETKKAREAREAARAMADLETDSAVLLTRLDRDTLKGLTTYPVRGMQWVGAWDLYYDGIEKAYYLRCVKDDSLYRVEMGDITE